MLYAPDNARDYLGIGKDIQRRGIQGWGARDQTRRAGSDRPHLVGPDLRSTNRKCLLFMNTWVTDQEEGGCIGLAASRPSFTRDRRWWPFSPATSPLDYVDCRQAVPAGTVRRIIGIHSGVARFNLAHQQLADAGHLVLRRQDKLMARRFETERGQQGFPSRTACTEQVGYYDPQRKLVIVQRRRRNLWIRSGEERMEEAFIIRHRLRARRVGARCLCSDGLRPLNRARLARRVQDEYALVLRSDKPAWTRLQPEGDAMPEGNKRLAYFDPLQKVFVIIRGTTVWAYRYGSGPGSADGKRSIHYVAGKLQAADRGASGLRGHYPEICKLVYPSDNPYTLEELTDHGKVFPQGQFVAIDIESERVAGVHFTLRLRMIDFHIDDPWDILTAGGSFLDHVPDGPTLYGADISGPSETSSITASPMP